MNEGTVFAYLIRKEGLPNPGIAIDEKETILAKAKSLNIAKTQAYPYNVCVEGILPFLLEVPDKTLRLWNKGETVIQEKARDPGEDDSEDVPRDHQPSNTSEVVKDICEIITMC